MFMKYIMFMYLHILQSVHRYIHRYMYTVYIYIYLILRYQIDPQDTSRHPRSFCVAPKVIGVLHRVWGTFQGHLFLRWLWHFPRFMQGAGLIQGWPHHQF